MSRAAVDTELEEFRQLVIKARSSADVEEPAARSLECLRELFRRYEEEFTPEDIRWINVLKGFLRERLAAHRTPAVDGRLQRKRPRGKRQDHCFRCKTKVDERFHDVCNICSSPTFRWIICPVCGACGCDYVR
jgi:hypothetical protein